MEPLLAEAKRLFQAKAYRDCYALLRKGCRANQTPRDAKFYNSIGAVTVHLGKPGLARPFLFKALELDPGLKDAHLNLAVSFSFSRNYEQASHHFESAICLAGDDNELLAQYVIFLVGREQLEAAHPYVQKLSTRANGSARSHYACYEYYNSSGQQDQALRAILLAVEREPGHELYLHRAAAGLIEKRKFAEAQLLLERLEKINPQSIVCYMLQAVCLFRLSDFDRNLGATAKLLELLPDSLEANLNHQLLAPIIPRSEQEFRNTWHRCAQSLRSLRNMPLRATGHNTWTHLFFFAYYDRSVRWLFEGYTAILAGTYLLKGPDGQPLNPGQGQHARRDAGSGKIRLGFASQFFHYHSNSRAFEGLIKHVDRSKFDVFIINAPQSFSDEVRTRIEQNSAGVLNLSGEREDFNKVINLDLDVIFYTDLGMNFTMYELAANKPAPIQLTGWGIPHTSGLQAIDYYISSDLAEPPNGQDHYSETLVRLEGLPCCYLSSNLGEYAAPRDYFCLPPGAPLFGCLQSLYKMNPQFDAALEAIAQRNPEAGFVLVENSVAAITERYLERVRRTAPTFAEQLVMLTLMGHREFMALSSCLDVLLDPFHYCSGVSFYESTYTGTPTVTLEGRFLRSRLVAAAYRLIGLSDAPIAQTPAEYVEIATDLINNREKLAALKEELRSKARGRLYDDLSYVCSFEQFCERVVRR